MRKKEIDNKGYIKNIMLSNTEANKIKNIVLNSKNRNRAFKPKYALLLTVIIFLTSTTIVYGKNLVSLFKGFFFNTEEINNPENENISTKFKVSHFIDITNIPDGKVFSENDLNAEFNYNDIEKKLGTKILKNSLLDKKDFVLNAIGFNDKNLSKIGFAMENNPIKIEKSGNEEKLIYSFRIWTQFSTDDERDKYSNYINAEYYEMSTYHIDSLNVDAYIFEPKEMNNLADWQIECNCFPIEARIFFAYNGVLYKIFITRVDRHDFYKFLDSFTL